MRKRALLNQLAEVRARQEGMLRTNEDRMRQRSVQDKLRAEIITNQIALTHHSKHPGQDKVYE